MLKNKTTEGEIHKESDKSLNVRFPAIFCSILSFLILFGSCVSKDKYDELARENESLHNELNGIKYGAPAMLSDAKKFLNSKDFINSKTKLEAIVQKYPDLPVAAEAKLLLNEVNEELIWSNAINSDEIISTETYISRYPNGRYQSAATKRISALKANNEIKDYNSALSANSSQAWKAFKNKYPNRTDISDIETRIIQIEVNEIYDNSETGRLPPSTSIGYNSHSTSSSVNITNDTGCELVVRYSGPSVKIITIASRQTSTVYLENGSYRIAASACGSNYAGSESLTGEYSSRYYIITSRY